MQIAQPDELDIALVVNLETFRDVLKRLSLGERTFGSRVIRQMLWIQVRSRSVMVIRGAQIG